MNDSSATAESLGADAVEVSRVSKWYPARDGDDVVLDSVDLNVARGEFVTIVGPSGCGKSTLLRLIAGLIAPSAGQIRVAGLPSEQARQQHRYSMAFQTPGLLEWRDVSANIALPLEIAGVDRTDRGRRVEELLELVGLSGVAHHKVWELSGGMQQRVALARALALQPDLLLLDEPFAALDELTRERLQQQLGQLQRETSVAVVMVTHSIREAALLGDRIVVMGPKPGRVVEVLTADSGTPVDVLTQRARSALEGAA